MEAPSTSSGSLSTHSSASSIAEENLKTPLDVTYPSTPNSFTDSKVTINMFSSRLEMLPKRSSTAPNALRWPSVALPPAPSTKTTLETRPDRRTRRTTNASLSSTFSSSSNNSLLRVTLLLATSSSSSFRPHSRTFSSPTSSAAVMTPTGTGSATSLLTSRASSSSIASTALSNPILPPAGRAHSQKVPPSSPPKLPLNLVLAAEPTTALSPTISPSLAQFSPTANATNSLLRYGIGSSTSWSQNRVAGHAKSEVRRRRSRDRREASPADRTLYSGHNGNNYDRDATDALRRKPNNLPSISRALEPDMQSPSIWAVAMAPSGSVDSHTRENAGVDVPVQMPYHRHHGGLAASNPRGTQEIAIGHKLPGTPRPAFPIQHTPHRSSSSLSTPTVPKVLSAVDKGKGRAFTMPLPRASSPGLTKTHFSHLLPSAKTETKSLDRDLPTLDAIECNSRLMRGKTVCSSCGDVGPDFPRCGRCSQAWCSRECRMKTNAASVTGKHQCKR